ncbi:cuticle protein 38-like [Musca vetustissima]|uniref:cuticle protein 38-like n=1 Tax=Musca vetustissima TaxID=27455 RepID=UPI002AB7ABD6|nr:cuticle protein 38-like [Musca vetustissima]
MFKFVIVFAACLAYASAGVVAPTAFAAAPAVGYANAPLYAAGGSSQIDVRHNYDDTLSSYTTTPFAYSGPYSSRYVAGPAAYAAPTAFAAPAKVVAPAAYAAPAAFAAPAKYVTPAGVVAPYATPYGAQFAAPYATYPAGVAATYTAPAVAGHAHVVA